MLLSHSKQFLFVHIAKTGGTSVRAALSRYRWGHRYALAQFICNKMSQFTDHKIASRFPRHSRIIAAKEMLPETYFNQLFKFAVARNPWDLQVSSFHHIKRERPAVMQGYNDFESFMKWKFDEQRPSPHEEALRRRLTEIFTRAAPENRRGKEPRDEWELKKT